MDKILFGQAPITRANIHLESLTIDNFIKLIKTDGVIKEATNRIRKEKDLDKKKDLKKELLDYVIPFDYLKPVRNTNNFNYAKYMIFEADNVANVKEELSEIQKDPRIFITYTSVSNNGYKFMVKLNNPVNKNYYIRTYNYFKNMFNREFGIELDPACSDMARVQFLCHDPDLYFNENAKPLDVKEIIYQLSKMDEEKEAQGGRSKTFQHRKEDISKAILHMRGKGYLDRQDEALWWKLSMSLASLGEEGRKFFIELSCDHPNYPQDTEAKMNKKFDQLLKNYGAYHDEERLLTLATFFSIAKKEFGFKMKESKKASIEILLRDGFAEMYQGELVFDHSRTSGQQIYGWYFWNGKKYERAEKGQVGNYYLDFLDKVKYDIMSANSANDAVDEDSEMPTKLTLGHIAKAQTGRHRDSTLKWAAMLDGMGVRPNEFDTDTNLINLDNGVFDIMRNKFLPHDQKYLMTKASPIKYEKNIKCHAWETFLNKIFFNNKAIINYVQEAIGYSLTGETSEHCLFFLFGNGANGKSTFLDTLAHIFGDYAINANYESFTKSNKEGSSHSEDLVRLRGARMVTTTEIDSNRTINESLIKGMTSGDTLTARALHSESVEFKPQFKLWIAGNHRPKLANFDDGIKRRFKIIPFNYKFTQEEIRPQSEVMQEFKNEAAGILEWALEGARRWIKRGKRLDVPMEVNMETQKYFMDSNIVSQFLDFTCNKTKFKSVDAQELYNMYKTFAVDNGESDMGRNKFYQRLSELEFKRERDNTKGRMVIKDLEFKSANNSSTVKEQNNQEEVM